MLWWLSHGEGRDAVTWCGWDKLWKGRNYWTSRLSCQVYVLRGVSWWLCVCFTWLDMTTRPWCREKVMVYYYYPLSRWWTCSTRCAACNIAYPLSRWWLTCSTRCAAYNIAYPLSRWWRTCSTTCAATCTAMRCLLSTRTAAPDAPSTRTTRSSARDASSSCASRRSSVKTTELIWPLLRLMLNMITEIKQPLFRLMLNMITEIRQPLFRLMFQTINEMSFGKSHWDFFYFYNPSRARINILNSFL